MNDQPMRPESDTRELVLDRLLDAPREKLFRIWTDPSTYGQWFCPKPWTVTKAELDVRPGGKSFIVMQGPEGQEFPSRGIYLDVVKNEKIVFTDAFTDAWTPSDRAFMVATVTFADEGGKTRYRAVARHWTPDARAEHEKMGFHEGWGIVATQLEALAKSM
ncbi:SRPBCC family protein [Dongia sp.]|uniref:SRPBCC family protein n=1 Tax=Dongia sp. TaxID=1977262 RepID=UPI0035AF9371